MYEVWIDAPWLEGTGEAHWLVGGLTLIKASTLVDGLVRVGIRAWMEEQ